MPKPKKSADPNRDAVIEWVFNKCNSEGATEKEVPFTIGDIRQGIKLVSEKNPAYGEENVPDVLYHFRSGRGKLPQSVEGTGPWMIVGRGKGRYAFFRVTTSLEITVPPDLEIIYLPDATPEIVLEYAGSDEQGILAKLNYNRVLDIFLQLACYHLQNHWRSSVKSKGQCEIDDLYVGLNNVGKQFVIPVWRRSVSKTSCTKPRSCR